MVASMFLSNTFLLLCLDVPVLDLDHGLPPRQVAISSNRQGWALGSPFTTMLYLPLPLSPVWACFQEFLSPIGTSSPSQCYTFKTTGLSAELNNFSQQVRWGMFPQSLLHYLASLTCLPCSPSPHLTILL